MSGPRFKLDLVTYDDPAALLPLPVAVEPSRATLLQDASAALDAKLANDVELLDELNTLLSNADISFVHPLTNEVATTQNPSSHLARSLANRSPYLFQYGVLDVEAAATPVATTPGPSSWAVAAHNSQPDAQSNPPTRKQRSDTEPGPSERKRTRRAPNHEVYILSSDEVQAAADKLGAFLTSTLAAAADAGAGRGDGEEDEADGDHEDEEEEDDDDTHMGDQQGDGQAGGPAAGPQAHGRGGGRVKYRFRLEGLRQLHQELLMAQAQGYLRLVPTERLQALLAALHQAAGAGRNRLIAEDAELKSHPVARVVASLEAVLCELVVLSSPRMPPALYLEEQLGRALELTRYHLQYNVMALHDVRFRRLYRPGSLEEGMEEHAKGGKVPRGRGGRSATGHLLPRWCSLLAGQLEQALALLAEVAAGVRLGAEGLIPLARMAQQALTVDSLQTLHYRALGLAVSMFKSYPQQRNTVLDEFVQSVLSYLSTGKHVARHYPLRSTDPPARIQMCSALVMQLVQAAAELPAVDTGPAEVQSAVHVPTLWADHFWAEIFNKLPAPRAARSDGAANLKGWLEALVEDLLAALPLPEWPAAALLLRRLLLVVNSEAGMRSADSGVKLACLDLVGLIARRLCVMAQEADAPEAGRLVGGLLEAAMASAGPDAAPTGVDKPEVVQQLMLEHLAAASPGSGGGGTAAAAALSVGGSARRLIVCTLLATRIKALRQGLAKGEELDDAAASGAVVHYRQIYERQRSCLGASTSGLPEVSREAAVALCRWLVVDSVLGRSRSMLLRWLADAGGGGRARQEAHAAPVRAKAIKLLGAAIEADVRALSMVDVQEGIKGALCDDSVMVREAAVELIGKHISRSAELAAQYYDVLVHASEDAGLTVRKRAIRLLWECCVRCPDFRHRSDALLRIVARATDSEDTMRSLVTKICAELWFLPKIELADEVEVSHVSRGPRQRAGQLGELLLATYGRMGAAASVPFHAQLPIVVTLRGIVGEEGQPDTEAVRAGAQEVADALLARALELQGEADPAADPADAAAAAAAAAASDELFGCLLALHALAVADARLLHRPDDPQRLVRSLAPYIKEVPQQAGNAASRRRAEQLLVVLALLGGAMGPLRHLDDKLADEIAEDLIHIMNRVPRVQAVTTACQCLCSLALLKPKHRATVRQQANRYYAHMDLARLKQDPSCDGYRRMLPRFMFTAGTLCRYGANMLDEEVEGSKHPNCLKVLEMVLYFYGAAADNVRVREAAIQALGLIFIARPHLAVDVRDVRPVLEGALSRSAPAPVKSRCLTSLTELLRAEEEALVGRQAAARQEAAAAQQASTLPEAEGRALARRNGEGDTGSVSSGLIQMLWSRVVALATDTSPAPAPSAGGSNTPPPTPSGTASAHGAVVRRRALELIEVIIRGGIVVPWSAIPALCALATDPERDTACRALACLRGVVAANTAFAAGQVPAGVAEAYAFHVRLAEMERPGQALSPGKCRPLLEGLSSVWVAVFQPDRALKAKFLTALLKPLDDGCCLASGSAAKSDPHLLSFLAYLIAELPYKKMDELLAVLFRVNEILSRRAEAVLARLQELRHEQATKQEPKDGEAAAKPRGTPANGAHPSSPLPSPLPSPLGGRGNAPAGLAATVKAAFAVSLMLLLKQYLRLSYDLTTDRVAKYDPSGPQRKVEEKLNAIHNSRLKFNASSLRLDVAARLSAAAAAGPRCAAGAAAAAAALPATSAASGTPSATAPAGGGEAAGGPALDPGVQEVYKVLKTLMKQDELDYRHATAPGDADAEEAGPLSPADEAGGVAINLEDMMAAPGDGPGSTKPPLASRGRGRRGGGRGSRGGAVRGADGGGGRGRGRGRGRAAAGEGAGGRGGAAGKRGRKRKARADSDDEDEDGDGGDDSAEEEDYKPRTTKRRKEK